MTNRSKVQGQKSKVITNNSLPTFDLIPLTLDLFWATTGPPIGKNVMGTLKSFLSIVRKIVDFPHAKRHLPNARAEVEMHRRLLDYIRQYVGKPVRDLRVLEIGCGPFAAQTALFYAAGAHTTGIDLDAQAVRLDVRTLWRTLRRAGLESTLRTVERYVLAGRKLPAALSRAYGRRVPLKGLDIRIMDAAAMTFESSSVDFIFSIAVFEHLSEVEKTVKEMNRVLAPGGIAYTEIHLFPSLSGGHSLEWRNPDNAPSKIEPPWEHLRNRACTDSGYLNRMKLKQYSEIFNAHTSVLGVDTIKEGEKILTQNYIEEFREMGYIPKDLPTRQAMFLVRKKNE